MADNHECTAIARQPFLEPFDCGEVEMVGRLVEQQQVRFARQSTADCGAALFAPARSFGFAVEINAQLIGNCAHRIFRRAFLAMNCEIHQPIERGDIGILIEHHDVGAGNNNAFAFVRLDGSRYQLHQCGFARTVTADQRQPVTRADEQVDILKQPPAALLKAEFFKREDGRLRHSAARIGGRLTLRNPSRKASPMRTIYLNGSYIPEGEGKVSVFDRGFLFSDSVYEVVSVLDGKLVDFDGHVRRLARSLGELGIKGAPDADAWLAICRELVIQNAVEEGMIYWQVTRGAPADRDFVFPPENTAPTILAFTQSRSLADNPAATRGISVVTLPDLRWGRADIKTTQLLYASLMKNEAIAKGADDAWMERGGVVTEGTAQNAHIITKEGVLVTHPLNREILHGITRAAVLPMVAQTIEERPFTVAEAEQAAEAFVSSASGFVMPVVRINGKAIGDGNPGSATIQLRKAYIDWARRTAI
jgi:D-alanine transaminase